jgi:ribosomal protein L30E
MIKQKQFKIDLPAWLVELISKGKYSLGSNQTLPIQNCRIISNGKISILDASLQRHIKIHSLNDYYSMVNGKKVFKFFPEKGLIVIDENND